MSDCGIVKDLLPLYADDVCSIESKKLVSEHLAECESCQKELESYELDVIITENTQEKEALKKFKKKTERRVAIKIFSVILAVAIGIFSTVNVLWLVKGKMSFDKYSAVCEDYHKNGATGGEDVLYIEKDNPFGIDTGEFEKITLRVNKPSYLNYDGEILIFDDRDADEELSLTLGVYQESPDEYVFHVNLEHFPHEEVYESFGFLIDENLNLIEPDIDHLVNISYEVYLCDDEGNKLETDEEKKNYVRKELEEDHAEDERMYEENYENIKVLMNVFYEVFGNVTA